MTLRREDLDDGITVLTIDRPAARNALSPETRGRFAEYCTSMAEDEAVRAVVITGAGDHFCAGGDVKAMGDRATGAAEKLDPGNLLRGAKYIVQRFVNCEVPLIAAINGHAVGLGATIGLLCDVTFIAEDAKIGDNHVRVGITAGDGGALIWPYLIGVHKAKDMLMSGRLITGREAHELGVTNYCYPKEEVLDRAIAYAEEIAAGARVAVRFTKIAINKHLWDGLNRVMDFCLISEQLAMATEDHKEATTAFSEKRAPVFTGY